MSISVPRPRRVERQQPLQDGGVGQVGGPAVGGAHGGVQPGVRLGQPGRAGVVERGQRELLQVVERAGTELPARPAGQSQARSPVIASWARFGRTRPAPVRSRGAPYQPHCATRRKPGTAKAAGGGARLSRLSRLSVVARAGPYGLGQRADGVVEPLQTIRLIQNRLAITTAQRGFHFGDDLRLV